MAQLTDKHAERQNIVNEYEEGLKEVRTHINDLKLF